MYRYISDVNEKLRSREYKLTSRREHILKVLLENTDKHLSAEEIYHLVKLKAPETGLATVYRTLELFLDLEIIHSMDFGDGRRRFEFGSGEEGDHRHHHLICTGCGKITEVNEDLLEELESKVKREYDFDVNDHQLKIFGMCKDCSTGKSK